MKTDHPPAAERAVEFDVVIDHSGGLTAEYPCEAEQRVGGLIARSDEAPSQVTRAALDAIREALRIVTEGARETSPLLIGWAEAAALLGLCVPKSGETVEHATTRGVRTLKRRFERGQIPERWLARPKARPGKRGGNRGRVMFWRVRLLADGGVL